MLGMLRWTWTYTLAIYTTTNVDVGMFVCRYTVRFEDMSCAMTKIRFITDGSLLREALADRLMRKYSVIVLDEAHERTVNTDVLFGIVKEAQRVREQSGMPPLTVNAVFDLESHALLVTNQPLCLYSV